MFSAQSLSSQRRNWEESVAWGWCWGLASRRPVLNLRQHPGQRSPWSHWRAPSSSGRCPGLVEEVAYLTPLAPCPRVRGRGQTGAPVRREGPQKCRVDSSSSCVGVRAARSEWRSGCGSAGCRPATRNRKRWRWCSAGGWTPLRSTPPQSGAAGRPTRSKGAGGAGGCCGSVCRRCGTSSAASNMDSGFPGSLRRCCNPHFRRRSCRPPSSLSCRRCQPTLHG